MKMRRGRDQRKPGRKMPHTDEAVREDGTLDLVELEKAMADVIASFKSGEYQALRHTVADMGDGTELYIMHRKKMR